MTLVLVGVSALFWGWPSKIEVIGAPGILMLDWCILAALADISHRFQLKHFFCWGWFCQGVSFNELQGGQLGLDFTERHVQGRVVSFRDGNHIPHTSNLAQKNTNSSTYLAFYFSPTLTLLAVSLLIHLFTNPMDPSIQVPPKKILRSPQIVPTQCISKQRILGSIG